MRFILVDWGTSRFRAYVVDGTTIVERVASEEGVSALRQGQHQAVFRRHCGPWLEREPEAPVALVGMVGSREGWVVAPPGTRLSTYSNPDYQKAAPFSNFVLKAIEAADPSHPTVNPVPYTGVQFVAIPEFQGIGTTVGQDIAAALAGQTTGQDALKKAQASTERTMKQAGYPK